MAIPIICKLLQKQTYDFLSQRYAIVLCFIGSILVIVSAFHFGETMLEWSKDKYVAVFNSFSDNVAGRSFQNRLCSYLPIDVVYTWVNGSDPKLIQELNKVKADILLGLNFSGPVKCTYAYCFQSNMVLINPTLPVNYTLLDLAKANPFFLKAMNLAWMKSPQEGRTNESVSVVVFEDFETVPHVLTEYLLINGRNYSVRETYLTTEWTARNSILLEDTVILTGIPSGLTQELLLQHLPRSVQSDVHKMLFYPEKSLVVLVTTDKDTVEKLIDYDGNFTVGDKEQNIHTANLVLKLHDDIIIKDALASRFEDNEELRYSLRSVEKHAPWVRHIYIVTNGQIPYWLALDNPKVTVVTHEEIFLNNSDLPTFSSPAIESHIHRIPGLSQKFIYMNDDVMFGKDVWPEDFYTHSKGQKVYLTWAVPGCKEGCPTSWIKDGYCDKPCNSSECDWDGGDCLGAPDLYNIIGMRNNLNFLSGEDANKAYCSLGCTNTWLADRYCDQACNVLACGFDAGDCGLINFNQLYQLELFHNQTEYSLPPGKTLAYFDLKTFLTDIVLTRGAYEENAMIRVIAIIHKYKILTVLLFPNYNATTLTLTVEGFKKTAEEKIKFTFNLTADTLPQNESESVVETTSIDVIKEKKEEQNGIVIFEEFPEDKRFPKIPLTKSDDLDFLSNIQVDEDRLSEFTKMQIKNLHQKLKDGDLTQKGFNIQKARILKNASNLASFASHLELNKPRAINLIYPDNSLKEYNQAEQFYPGLQLGDKNQSHFFQVNLIDGKRKTAESKGEQKNQHQFENKPKHRKLLTLQKSFRNRHLELTTKSSKKEDKPRLKLDRFGDSLRHVNKLLNSAYGYEVRKVPGHIPHMIDVEVMHSLHERFPEEFAATSSHPLRSSTDMQFAFSYFYFLMSEPKEFNIEDIFNTFDTDNSGTWSDREIRTIVARLYKLPLDYESMMQFENIIINCSKFLPSHLWDNVVTPPLERYHDSKLPTVSKQLVKSCDEIQKVLMKTFSGTKKHKFEIMGEDENSFKMIRNNVSWLVGQLDDIRKNPKKFICLNDDMDYQNDVIPAKAVLQDFYESLFPIPSQFELSHEFRNRFLHIHELREWRKYRDLLKLWTHICLIALIIFTLGSFCHNQVVYICRRLMFHRTLLLRGRQDHMLSV